MKALIEKFLTDSITQNELDELRAYLQHPEHRQLFKAYVRDHYDLNLSQSQVDLEEAYNDVWAKIREQDKAVKPLMPQWLKYAAVFIALIGTSYAIYISGTLNSSNDPTTDAPQVMLRLDDGTVKVLDESKLATFTNRDGRTVVNQEYDKLVYTPTTKVGAEPAYNELIVPYGKRFEVALSDGTVVFLNAGTKLRYPTAFTDPDSREVYLDGEAYFSVKENKDRPFMVHTEEMNIRVLGTKFNVSSYKNENNSSVVLAEGSVAVYASAKELLAKQPLVIEPGQQALFQNGKLEVKQVYVEKHIAWVDGKLFFTNDRFENIVQELERHYNVKIINTYKALNDTRYTGTFKDKTLEEILTVFKANTLFEHEVKGKTITLTQKKPI